MVWHLLFILSYRWRIDWIVQRFSLCHISLLIIKIFLFFRFPIVDIWWGLIPLMTSSYLGQIFIFLCFWFTLRNTISWRPSIQSILIWTKRNNLNFHNLHRGNPEAQTGCVVFKFNFLFYLIFIYFEKLCNHFY